MESIIIIIYFNFFFIIKDTAFNWSSYTYFFTSSLRIIHILIKITGFLIFRLVLIFALFVQFLHLLHNSSLFTWCRLSPDFFLFLIIDFLHIFLQDCIRIKGSCLFIFIQGVQAIRRLMIIISNTMIRILIVALHKSHSHLASIYTLLYLKKGKTV